MNLSALTICTVWFGLDATLAFSSSAQLHKSIQQQSSTGLFANSNDDDAPNIDDDGEADWRAFRAKLVMSESSSTIPSTPPEASPTEMSDNDAIVDDEDLDGFGALFSTTAGASSISNFTPLDPSQWAYDSGKVIETGAVILGGVEQDFGFGLRQQYFHKAAILVLDHDEATFTKGIILNRPSDRMMDDDINEGGLKWRVWFGGDVQGLDSLVPEIVCLHSLKSKEALECSNTVIAGIQWTSFENAKKLVKKGVASGPEDFWLFAGYAGWGPMQLAGELDRKSWYMCATDSGTLLKELARQSKGVDPRDAGLDTWELLMNMIGREELAKECSGSFDDLMLKEWSQANLVKFDYGTLGLTKNPAAGDIDLAKATVDNMIEATAKWAQKQEITPGTLLRASSADRSPFLLQKQEMHHGLLLVIQEDDKVSLGCMLNQVSMKGVDIRKVGSSNISIPIRYGGDYAIKGQGPLLWIHCNQKLRDAGLGEPIGEDQSKGFWKCSQEEAVEAITYNIAEPQDFLVLSGVCVWPKLGGSLGSEVSRGVFERVPESKYETLSHILQAQELLTKDNLSKNIGFTDEAWEVGADANKMSSNKESSGDTLTTGIGEGFDEDDDTVVFNSDKLVSELASDAHKKWTATFLLGAPTLSLED